MSSALRQLLIEIESGPARGLTQLTEQELQELLRLPPESRQRLERLFALCGAENLGDLAKSVRHNGTRMSAPEQHALCRDLEHAISTVETIPPPNPARVIDPRALESEADIVAWCRARDLVERLNDPSSVLDRSLSSPFVGHFARNYGSKFTVADLIFGRVPEMVLKAFATSFAYIAEDHLQLELRAAGKSWLLSASQRQHYVRQVDARIGEIVASTEPALEGARTLIARLREMRQKMGTRCPPPALVAATTADLYGRSVRLYASTVMQGRWVRARASLDISGWERGEIGFSCGCEMADCNHLAAAIEAAFALLIHPQGTLAQLVSVPTWQRMLGALDQALEERARSQQTAAVRRIAWRLTIDEQDRPLLVPLLQRANKNGKFSKGAQASPSRLLGEVEGLETSPTDRKVLELLADAEWLSAPRAYRALELLRGHPRLFDHFQNPVTVVEAELRVELQRAGEGYVLRTFFGDCELRPDWIAACCEGSRYFVDLDDDATCRISELSQVGHALIMTLAMTGDFVPAHAMDELLRRLPELQQHVDIVLPPEVLGRRVAASTGLVAQISWLSSEDVVLSLRSRPVPGGPSLEPGRGVSRIVSGSRGRRVHALRDLVRERELARELLSAPGLRDAVATGRFERRVSGREELVRMLGALRERSQDVRVEWLGDPLEMLAPIPRRALRFQITGKGGLLDLDGHVDLGGERVALAALLDAARSGREWVQLSPRRFAQLEEDLRSTLSGLAELTQSQTKAEVSPALAPMLDELIEGLEVADRSALTSALARQKAAAAHTAELPATLKAVLRPYQAEGFQWLSRLATWGVGACLADDMGLGKTLQCLALLLTRSHTGPALIVAPTSVADNWRNEAARFAPELDVRIYRGQHRKRALDGLAKGSILIASYDLAARDVDALAKLQFATLVLDEAQAVKNSHTQRTKAIRKLNAEFRVALTGTPLENHVGELWSIFRILEPGLLGTWDWFSQRFAQPIEIEGDQRRLEALRRLLRPFILRRTKQQVLPELPERVEVVQQVELSPGERTLYHTAHLAALARAREGGSDARMEVLAAITRLRRLVCHPALYDKTSTLESSKLHALLGLMEELREEGRRALVFSQFTSFLELARAKLEAAGFSLQQLDGSTPATDRAKRVEAFQDGEGDAFLISLKAGGTGLNLTAADTVILLDPWWNPAVEDQAADRAHRFGQKRSVTIVRLVASNTIEDKVIAMHRDKRDLAERLLSGTDVGSKLTSEALLELLEDAAAVDVTPSRKAPKQKRPRRSSQATSPRDS